MSDTPPEVSAIPADGPKSDKKAPGFWFYTADYERDMQILSLGAQGLWSRMLCWMSDNEAHRGFAELPTGEPMNKWDIASRVGKPVREIEKFLAEMQRVGVFSVDDRGCFFSRRMARDHHISSVRKLAAKSRLDNARRAANGAFAGDFAPANQPAKEQQNPTVTASVPVPVSASVSDDTSTGEENPFSAPGGAGAAPTLFAVGPIKPTKPADAWFTEKHDEWYYRAYWNRQDRKASRKAYRKRVLEIVDKKELTYEQATEFLFNQAVIDQKRSESTSDWDWRRNLHPATWLNGERWEDDVQARARDSPNRRKDFVSDVTDVIGGRLARGENPW